MRDKLAPHLNEFVLSKGWIEDWKSVDENITQVYIKNPLIKEDVEFLLNLIHDKY